MGITNPAHGTEESVESPQPQKQKQISKNTLSGFIDLNGYRDTRGFSEATINVLTNLPYHFQYFSLTNFSNANVRNDWDLTGYYSEHSLRWSFWEKWPLALSVQWALANGGDNDKFRFGLLWKIAKTPMLKKFFEKIHMSFFVTFFGLDTNFSDPVKHAQIEYVYLIQVLPSLLKDRVYVAGFADQNFRFGNSATAGNRNIWVTEHQLGVRLVNWLYAVVEFRRNEFFAAQKNGVGFGAEYKLVF